MEGISEIVYESLSSKAESHLLSSLTLSDSVLPFVPLNCVKHTSPLNPPLENNALEGRKHVLLIFMSLRVPGMVLGTERYEKNAS